MDTLYDKLKKVRKFHKVAFHMPGSKGGRAIPRKYRHGIWNLDYTGVTGTDNLYAPDGIIKDAETRAADIYGSSHCFYLVNGSSCGILSAISYISEFGKKIIVDRGCHISALNALKLCKMESVFASPQYISEFGITGQISAEEIERLLQENPDTAAVFLTSPSYYGMVHDIRTISAVCKKYGKILCVDAAHGAHFAFSENFPECAVRAGADIVIMSVHKTLPAPTQASIMHISDNIDAALIKKKINIFQTTSPSYILMTYTDVAVCYMYKCGKKTFDRLCKRMSRFKEKCKLTVVPTDDFSRLVISTCKTGKSGFELSDYLEKHGIIVEAADLYNVICICGKGNSALDFKRLLKYCNRFSESSLPPLEPPADMVLSKGNLSGNLNLPIIEFDINDCAGKLSAETVTVYPPGVPVVFEGERFDTSQTEYISRILALGGKTIAVNNGKIKCFIENN
ncbi:MAG: aminotransferase class V-fold PLP-dependent enzyme [Clostridia bacterium]|nr:aminotransferase class V-fold PLP-dependent enzyme [Clostridia bacterium]